MKDIREIIFIHFILKLNVYHDESILKNANRVIELWDGRIKDEGQSPQYDIDVQVQTLMDYPMNLHS